MISIISPAKSMNFDLNKNLSESDDFEISNNSRVLIKELQSFEANDIEKTMNVSKKIAELNYERFQSYNSLPEKEAMFAYDGDVYKNIDKESFSADMLKFANSHFRIISALYGCLKPLSKIKPYRLEMVCKIPSIANKGLANYWKTEITNDINLELKNHKNKFLINIASNEYSAAIDKISLNFPMINVHFREIRNQEIKNIAINSKRARGMISDYIIRNSIDTPADIKGFNVMGYCFCEDMSNSENYYFIKK